MTPEKQRIAIAEACGWNRISIPLAGPRWLPPEMPTFYGGLAESEPLPDYLNDLNAMHEVEKLLTEDKKYDYGEHLRASSGNVGPKGGHFTPNGFGCFQLAHVTATQRAEAFLRAIGKWQDEPTNPTETPQA